MRADIYQAMKRVEDRHWWFRGRRAIIASMLESMHLPEGIRILDAGSGTGGNLRMLSRFGTVYAMEMEAEARALANSRGIVEVTEGKLPEHIPFGTEQFDLAAIFDVLEHIEDDEGALKAIHARLSAEGGLLLTVPAFQALWSAHDDMHHHKRRYTLKPLTQLVERAGYRVVFASYINFWLFPLIALVRMLDRASGNRLIGKKADGNAELRIPPAPINWLLMKIFAGEAGLIKRMRLQFGVSIILLAQKVDEPIAAQ